MFTLIKVVLEFLLAGAIFVCGSNFAIKYPNMAAKIKAMTTDLFTKKASS